MNVVEVKTTIHKYLHLEEKKLINAKLSSCDRLIIKKEVEGNILVIVFVFLWATAPKNKHACTLERFIVCSET